MNDVREGVEVEFECGHRMVYDKHSDQGKPELGEPGLCRLCPADEYGFPPERIVVGLRQCWIETSVRVVFDRDDAAPA